MKISKIQTLSCPCKIAEAFKTNGIEYCCVDNVNWSGEYPYKPDFKFALAHDSKNIYIHYKVDEKTSRAVETNDNGRTWEDSCVEFFISFGPEGYYNFECTCIGKLLLAFGPGRSGRESAPAQALESVKRWTSLPCEAFEEKVTGPWEVALTIPLEAFFKHEIKSFDGMKASANVYKCGDLLSTPHFISWNPIDTPTPDFHRPEFFKEIQF